MRWRLLDRLLACEPGRSALGETAFPPEAPFFAGPGGAPRVPGTLQIEMMAAAGGRALRLAAPDRLPLLAAVKSAELHRPIAPGERCTIRVEITQLHPERAAAAGVVEVAGERAAEAVLLYTLVAGAPEAARGGPPLTEPAP